MSAARQAIGGHALAPDAVPGFVEGGHAVVTVHNRTTGGRYTYRVVAPPPMRDGKPGPARFFVSVLNGPNNEADYAFIGSVSRYDDGFRPSAKSSIPADALSVRGFAWLWSHRGRLAYFPHVEVHHAGSCGRCGRTLTTISSLETGMGPVCATKGG